MYITPRRAVRIEASLPEHPLPAQFLYQMHSKKIHDLENEGQVREYTNHNGPIRWQISTSTK